MCSRYAAAATRCALSVLQSSALPRAIQAGVGIAVEQGGTLLQPFVAFDEGEGDGRMDRQHGLRALDGAETAPAFDDGAFRLRGEGDDLAGEVDAEARGADQHFVIDPPHPHVVAGVVEQIVGHGAVENFTHDGLMAERAGAT